MEKQNVENPLLMSEFIPYPLALRLKALGFKERVLTYFEDDKIKLHDHISGWDFNSSFLNCVSRPTYSQAFRWFRDHHNIECTPTAVVQAEKKWYNTSLIYNQDIINDYTLIETYEEAELACLTKLIEIKEERHQEEWDLYLKQKEDGKDHI